MKERCITFILQNVPCDDATLLNQVKLFAKKLTNATDNIKLILIVTEMPEIHQFEYGNIQTHEMENLTKE